MMSLCGVPTLSSTVSWETAAARFFWYFIFVSSCIGISDVAEMSAFSTMVGPQCVASAAWHGTVMRGATWSSLMSAQRVFGRALVSLR